MVHVEDAARAAAIALRVRGEVFNVAEDEPLRRGSWEEFGVREVFGLVEVRGSVTQN